MEKAKESGHWYTKNAEPAYTQPNKSKPGETRNTTVRDARKLNLTPSVTTVMSILAKPGLDIWKRNQLLMAALTLPEIAGETLEQYSVRVVEDAAEHGKQAREKGTMLHGVLENYFLTGNVQSEYSLLVSNVKEKLFDKFGFQDWKAEKSFSSNRGYGGKVDLHSGNIVVDFKTSEFTADKQPRGWPEQVQQLAAYQHGLGISGSCVNVYISTIDYSVYVKEWSKSEVEHGLKCFLSTLELWKNLKKFDPSF